MIRTQEAPDVYKVNAHLLVWVWFRINDKQKSSLLRIDLSSVSSSDVRDRDVRDGDQSEVKT